MQNSNRNTPSPVWKIFTLLGFLVGVLLYIFIKREKDAEERPVQKNKGLIPEPKKLPKTVSKEKPKEDKVDLNLETPKLSNREKKIVKELIEKGKVYPSELQELLPNVSSRTIRRDMNGLEKLGLVEQKGATKSTYYNYIGS
jgi:predicted HTH transcriptional regulator